MNVIHTIALEGIVIPEPGELVLVAFGLGASVLGPLDVGVLAENTAVMKGRMLRRTPSLRSGFQPIGCSAIGFQRTKMS